jgi:hypothetical protein
MPFSIVASKWILSATAMVKITVGATADVGVKNPPHQPKTPIAVVIEITISMTTLKTADIERKLRADTNIIIPYMIGTNLALSLIADSVKALLIMTIPVN